MTSDEPYRWLEAVANRREYIRDQLKGGTPVFALSRPEGILLLGVGQGPVVSVVAICVAGFLYFTKLELTSPAKETASAGKADAPKPSPSLAPSASPTPTQSAWAMISTWCPQVSTAFPDCRFCIRKIW